MNEGRRLPIKIVEPPPVDQAAAWDKIRRGLIQQLAGIEELMGVPRTIPSAKERNEARRCGCADGKIEAIQESDRAAR